MKKVIFKILCNNISGRIISLLFNYNIPNIRGELRRYRTPKNYSSDIVRAMIFFGFYESAETRLIRKHLPCHTNIIELGSSLGVLSSRIIEKLSMSCDAIFVEANSYLLPTLERNLANYCTIANFVVINKMISYSPDSTGTLNISLNNTETRLGSKIDKAIANITVPTCRLGDLSLINDDYTLVCDIEGAEIDILLNDQKSLVNCSNLFIELHQTSLNRVDYSIDDMVVIIEKIGFSLRARDGNVFYFTKDHIKLS